jgi:hypothetical protein
VLCRNSILEQHRHLIFIDHAQTYIAEVVPLPSEKMLQGMDASSYSMVLHLLPVYRYVIDDINALKLKKIYLKA